MFKTKYEVVQFNNGKYGVRRSSFFGLVQKYADFKNSFMFWWGAGSCFIDDCMVDKQSAIDYYKTRQLPIATPIDITKE